MNSNKVIKITSPLNNAVIGEVPALSKAEVDEVIKQTKQVSKQWAQTSLYERGEYLYKVAHLLIKYHDELVNLLMKEVGKDRKSAKSEVLRTADLIRYTIETAKNIYGQAIPADIVEGAKKGNLQLQVESQ